MSKSRGAQKGNRNAVKKPDERRRKKYVSFFGQRWSIEVGGQIQTYLEQHGQSQKQFLDDVVKEKISTSNGSCLLNEAGEIMNMRTNITELKKAADFEVIESKAYPVSYDAEVGR